MKKVVITGYGIISCIGNSKAEVIQSLQKGKSGISTNVTYADMGFRSHVSGSINLELENFGFFPDEDNHLGGAVAILTETIEPRKSIIDQAAQLSEKLPKRKWALECLDELNNQETYNFILGWGLSFYKFNIKPNNKLGESISL